MTFHFAHMAPPGKPLRRAALFVRWLRDAQSDQLVLRRRCPAQVAPRYADRRAISQVNNFVSERFESKDGRSRQDPCRPRDCHVRYFR